MKEADGTATTKVRRGARIAYYAAGFALVSMELPVNVLIPEFYTDVVGVDVGTVAAVLLVARLFDAVNDPLIGVLTDNTRTRYGRRRPWVALGVLPLAAMMGVLFAPPELSSRAGAIYLLAALLATDLFWTAVTVPYEALGIEMTTSYDERTSVLGTRDAIALVAAVVFASLPAVLGRTLHLAAAPDGERTKFALYALLAAPLVVAACWWTAATARERGAPGSGAPPLPPLAHRLRALSRNRPFWLLLGSYTLGGIATQLPVTLHAFFVRYVLLADRADTFLPAFVASGVVALPLWLKLAGKTEKRTAYIAALLVSAAAQVATFFVGAGNTAAFWICTIASGVPFGALLAFPNAMQGDVIDLGAKREDGRREEGLYLGIWSISRKFAGAGGAAVGLFVLSSAGFVPNAAQSPAVLTDLRLLYTLAPAVLSVAAALACVAYPINRDAHAKIIAALEEKSPSGDS